MMDDKILQAGANSTIVVAPDEIGTPLEDAMSAPGPQERMDSCAIRAQQHVLAMYGIDVSETELVDDAIAHDEYNDGTALDDVGNLLERNGINVHRYMGATLAHLISELGQGHKVIVGIDANEIHASGIKETLIENVIDHIAEIPNHAVVVVDVDPHTFDVDIVDPADGQPHRLPAEVFADAWHDSGCFMVATDKAPSEYAGIQDFTPVMNDNDVDSFDVVLDTEGESTSVFKDLEDFSGDGISEMSNMDIAVPGTSDSYMVEANGDELSSMQTIDVAGNGEVHCLTP